MGPPANDSVNLAMEELFSYSEKQLSVSIRILKYFQKSKLGTEFKA